MLRSPDTDRVPFSTSRCSPQQNLDTRKLDVLIRKRLRTRGRTAIQRNQSHADIFDAAMT